MSGHRITGPSRFYLGWSVFRQMGTALLCLMVFPMYDDARSLHYVRFLAPWPAWAGLFAAVGALLMCGLVTECVSLVRISLATSVLMSVAWCVPFTFASFGTESAAPLVALLLFSLAGKDLAEIARPLINGRRGRK